MNDFKPNFTQIPNIVLDDIMADLNESELKVLLYICRRTYGFHKEKDAISLSQLTEGIVVGGEKLDKGTGLSKRAVISAVSSLTLKNIISCNKQGYINIYQIVQNSNQNGDNYTPNMVQNSNTQKKEKEIEIKIHSHKEYLIKIPENELLELSQKYKAGRTEIIAKGDQLFHWIESNDKRKYKNFRSLLMGALSRDYGLRRKENDASII